MLRLLLTYDGAESTHSAIEDLSRAGLPENGKIMLLSSDPSAKCELAAAARQIQERLPSWDVVVEHGAQPSAETILQMVSWWSPDLLVMGCARLPEGASSVAFEVVHRARCSVRLVTPGVTHEGPLRILLGDDGSRGALSAIRMLESRSWPGDTQVRLLAVGSETRAVPNLLQTKGLHVDSVQLEGDPRQVLVQQAETWHSDAVFLGAHGASASNRFLLGGVSTAVLTRLRRTIEVVR